MVQAYVLIQAEVGRSGQVSRDVAAIDGVCTGAGAMIACASDLRFATARSKLAFLFVRVFGRSTLGLAYGLGLADLLTSPAIPSNTARSGYIYPVMKAISETPSPKLIGTRIAPIRAHAKFNTANCHEL